MRILLVTPKSNFPDVTPGSMRIPQLTLPIIAALTPAEHEVRMTEEEFEYLPIDEPWDVVGITAMTANALRAYELSAVFKQNGAKVILGGIHPSVLPGEAARFADAVVIGEAEGVWQQVLHDVRLNRLRKFYYNSQPDISKSPPPVFREDRSILGLRFYVMPVIASRGCPYDCEFCCVPRVYGSKQRHIPVEHIIENINECGAKRVMFLDDNIGGVRSYAMELFGALKPLNINWYAQASARFILDDELFETAVNSGLKALFIGVEGVEREASKKMSKALPSVELVEKAIKRCRSAGVIFHASLIFGRDEDSPYVFQRTFDFLISNKVPSISPCLLTPYPGTPLFDRLLQERRILHTNWSYYDHTLVCYKPKSMEPEELAEKYLTFRKDFFSYSSIARRGYAQFHVAPLVYLVVNLAYRSSTKGMKEHFQNYFNWLHDQRTSPAPAPVGNPCR